MDLAQLRGIKRDMTASMMTELITQTLFKMPFIEVPSRRLFIPSRGHLQPWHYGAQCPQKMERAKSAETEIKQLLMQKNYPCVAALKSYHNDEYFVGFYQKFGSGESWKDLRQDLLFFLKEQRKSSSIYLSFWAIFEDDDLSEEDFESGLWKELSHLTSLEDRDEDWKSKFSSEPQDPNFRFCMDGSEFFVVGLHSASSRTSRRFSKPTLIFNVFEQFEELKKIGQFDAMVETNRKRDVKFQGSVNPMALEHGEQWESIQFSGKNNSREWKCPFQFISKKLKP